MSEAQTAQRDDSPMDVDQPSPLEQDLAPLGMTRFEIMMTFNLSLWTRCPFSTVYIILLSDFLFI